MFTGIVEQVGTIKSIKNKNLFTLTHHFPQSLSLGESIAVSGACMTVTDFTDRTFSFQAMAESREKTLLGIYQVGDRVNLERSAILGARNSGHFVTGHIDEVGEIMDLKRKDDFWNFRVKIDPRHRPLVVLKGSIALEGISLTILGVDPEWIEVGIISHTWENTNLSSKKKGDKLNIEYDILGKYVQEQGK